jgi:hypothetical protein
MRIRRDSLTIVRGDQTKAVDSHRSSEHAIHAELLAMRKRPGGLSPRSMAQCPVICDLLGNGDPEVAHVELTHKLIEIIGEEDDIMAVEAASCSLGFSAEANTHLARLQEFGDKHFLDQRQARRYSDRGLVQLVRLISSHWTTRTVPEATLIVAGIDGTQLGLSVQLRRQQHVDMHKPRLILWVADSIEPTPLGVSWRRTSRDDAGWIEEELAGPQDPSARQRRPSALCGEARRGRRPLWC